MSGGQPETQAAVWVLIVEDDERLADLVATYLGKCGLLVTVPADGPLLGRVVRNLLQNAERYSAADRGITVVARGTEEGFEVTVADRGIGIEAADIDWVFEPFFRAGRSGTRHGGGTGWD